MAFLRTLSACTRLRCGVGAGLLVCVAALALLGAPGHARADDAALAVQRLDQVPAALTVGVIGDSLMPLEGLSGDKLAGFSGDLLMQLIPQDRVHVIPRACSAAATNSSRRPAPAKSTS